MSRIPSDTCWCYFRNSLHAIYREIRHADPVRGPKTIFSPPPLFRNQAIKCRDNRETLESKKPYSDAFDQACRNGLARSTDAYVCHYQSLTDLTPEQVRDLFRMPGWRPRYGGEKWAKIADTVIELKGALDSSNAGAAELACEQLKSLEHNSGPLVPTREIWERDSYQRRKWPKLCED
jgi:hypothetical protein